MLLVLEGLDGSGKTTLSNMFQELGFSYRHYPVDVDLTLPQELLQQAMYEDMLQYKPPVNPARPWVLDRYWQSSFVYGMPKDLLDQLIPQLPKPTMSILLDISPEESIRRCQSPDKASRWDMAKLEQKQLWYQRYHMLEWDLVLNSEHNSPETLYQMIGSHLQGILSETFGNKRC